MTARLESIAMDIDSDRSPFVKSDSSSQTSFVDDYKNLTAKGPNCHAHVIDFGESMDIIKEDGMVKLRDAVVSTLYNVSPDTLKVFMNPTVNTFKAIFGKKDVQLVIWRKGLEVFIGTYEHHISLKIYRFEHVVGFLIGYDGSWHLKVTAGGACSNPKWSEVWAGKFDSYAGVSTMTVQSDEDGMARRASQLAESMLTGKFWDLKTDLKIK